MQTNTRLYAKMAHNRRLDMLRLQFSFVDDFKHPRQFAWETGDLCSIYAEPEVLQLHVDRAVAQARELLRTDTVTFIKRLF